MIIWKFFLKNGLASRTDLRTTAAVRCAGVPAWPAAHFLFRACFALIGAKRKRRTAAGRYMQYAHKIILFKDANILKKLTVISLSVLCLLFALILFAAFIVFVSGHFSFEIIGYWVIPISLLLCSTLIYIAIKLFKCRNEKQTVDLKSEIRSALLKYNHHICFIDMLPDYLPGTRNLLLHLFHPLFFSCF